MRFRLHAGPNRSDVFDRYRFRTFRRRLTKAVDAIACLSPGVPTLRANSLAVMSPRISIAWVY
jgi:hypothetical protein